MKLNELFGTEKKKEIEQCDFIRIDCKKCEHASEYGDPFCIRCISVAVKNNDCAKKIILDSGIEKEYGGKAVEIMKEVSECVPESAKTHSQKCVKCSLSPQTIEGEMWNSFSVRNIDAIITRMENSVMEDDDCKKCVIERKKALCETRNRLVLISRKATAAANRIIGV